MSASMVSLNHRVASETEWLEARRALLAKEKELTRQYDALVKQRQELPWVKVEKNYVFDTLEGKKTLGELFGEKSQLVIYHFMFAPEWEQGCPSCSMAADSFDNNVIHAAARDIAFTAVSRAPMGKIEEFRKRMGWSFPWVSSYGTEFNYDFGVSFSKEQMKAGKFYNFGTGGYPSEEAHGMSAFYRNEDGEVFHTYSIYARGLEPLLAVYTLVDAAPIGRHEEGLSYPMAWVRHHDRYEAAKAKASCECEAHQ